MDTFSSTGPEVTASLARALGLANAVLVEDEALASADSLVYASVYQSWLAVPYPSVMRNGVLVASGLTIALPSGIVTFAAAQQPADIITATFTFQPFTAADLGDLCTDALYAVEALLGATFDEAAVPRNLKEAVVTLAHATALRSLQSQTLEYYKWSIEQRSIDKSRVILNYTRAIETAERQLAALLRWLRPQYLAEGVSVVLNIDRGLPPNRYSKYRPPGWTR